MKKFVSLFIALALVMSIMLTGCSGSITIPDTNIELGFSMSQKDIEKLLAGLQGNTSSDKDEDKDDDKDTDYPVVGSVDIRNTVVTKDNKGNITKVEFDVTMNNVDKDDYKDAAAQACAIVITRLKIDIDDVKVARMENTSKSNVVHVTILLK